MNTSLTLKIDLKKRKLYKQCVCVSIYFGFLLANTHFILRCIVQGSFLNFLGAHNKTFTVFIAS